MGRAGMKWLTSEFKNLASLIYEYHSTERVYMHRLVYMHNNWLEKNALACLKIKQKNQVHTAGEVF